jgi:hypothetical protein
MSFFALSRLERLYLQLESTFGTIPNSSGTATLAGSNACRLVKGTFMPQVALIKRPDKTGTRSQLVGVLGRKYASWTIDMSLAPNGAAGVAPDCDPLLQGVFGQAPTVVSSTSVTYNLADTIPSLSMWSFRQPSTIEQRCTFGAVVQEMVLEAGPDVAMLKFSGDALWTLGANQFSVADTIQKGGLTSFPTEPSSPVTNGPMLVGFVGSIVIDSDTIVTLRTATMNMKTANVVIRDTFGTYYPTSAEGDERDFTLDCSIYEDDSAAYATMIAISEAKTPVTVVLTLGNVAGATVTTTLKNVQFAAPSQEEQRRYITNWSGSVAHATSVAVKDEAVMAWT